VEITSAAKAAGNRLEIDVVDLWPNRMIGDEQLPADCEYSNGAWILLKRLPDWFEKGERRKNGPIHLLGPSALVQRQLPAGIRAARPGDDPACGVSLQSKLRCY